MKRTSKQKLSVAIVFFGNMLFGTPVWAISPYSSFVAEQNANRQTVKTALDYVKNKMGYSIWYNVDDIDLQRNVNVSYRGRNMSDIMKDILHGQGLRFRISGKTIVIEKASQPQSSTRQKVSGRVFETGSGEPLIGVTVHAEGSGSVAITDINGNYTIEANEGEELYFSYLLYNTEVRKVGKQSVMDVGMESGSVSLNDVVVTGYQTMKKYNMTGSVNTIGKEQVELRSSNSLETVLEGAVPGLTVYDGEYRVRGGSSLNAGNTPLFIVDNFEVEQLPANMDQVETITVLKDAAATAIWGSRAANGVIVITTKRGQQSAPKISYSGNFKVSAKPDYSDLHRASSADLVSYEREAFMGGHYSPDYFDYSTNGYNLAQEIIMDYLVDDVSMLSAAQIAEMDGRLNTLAAKSNRKQIEDFLLRHAVKQNHMVSISGGGDKVNYFLSGSFTGGNSCYRQGDIERQFELNSRMSFKLLDNLTLRSNTYCSFVNNDNGYTSLASDIYNLSPYQDIVDQQGELVYDYSLFHHAFSDDMVSTYGYSHQGKNLLEEVNLSNSKTKGTDFKIGLGLDWRVINGLSLSADYQYERYQTYKKDITSKDSYYGRNLINYMAIPDEYGDLVYGLPEGDILDHSQTDTEAWIAKFGATLNRNFGIKNEHYVNAVAGFEMRSRHSWTESYRKFGYDDQTLSWKPIDQSTLSDEWIVWVDGNYHMYDATGYDRFSDVLNRELSYFLSATYTYDNRYTGSASLRFDESNLFGASHKYRRNPIY